MKKFFSSGRNWLLRVSGRSSQPAPDAVGKSEQPAVGKSDDDSKLDDKASTRPIITAGRTGIHKPIFPAKEAAPTVDAPITHPVSGTGHGISAH